MKNIFYALGLIVFGFSHFVFAEEAKLDFRCVNNMYREALLSIDNGRLQIQDDAIEGRKELSKIVQERVGLRGSLNIYRVSLFIPRNDVSCDSPAEYLLTCSGSTKTANIGVEGFVNQDNGTSGRVAFNIPVEVKDFELKTILASDGPHEIGGTPVTITMDTMKVEAKANVQVNGKDVQLQWTPFFKIKSDGEYSSCRKY